MQVQHEQDFLDRERHRRKQECMCSMMASDGEASERGPEASVDPSEYVSAMALASTDDDVVTAEDSSDTAVPMVAMKAGSLKEAKSELVTLLTVFQYRTGTMRILVTHLSIDTA